MKAEKIHCEQRCGFEDTFEPDEFGLDYYQAIGTCPNCDAPTVYEDGSKTAVVINFKYTGEITEPSKSTP